MANKIEENRANPNLQYPKAVAIQFDCPGELEGSPLDFNSNGKVLAIGATPDSSLSELPADFAALRLWHTDTYQETIFGAEFPEYTRVVHFSADGNLLAVAWGMTINIWDMERKQWFDNQYYWAEGWDTILSLVFTPDAKYLIGAYGCPEIFVWEVSTDLGRKRLQLAIDQRSTDLAMNSDGSEFATGSSHTGIIGLLEVESIVALFEDKAVFDGCDGYFELQHPTATFLHRGGVSTLRYCPTEKVLASGGADGVVRLWDTVTKQEIATLNHGDYVGSIDFSPDGALLFSSGGGALHVWHLSTCQKLETFNEPADFVRCSPCGKFLASASKHSEQVSLWK